MVTFYDKYLDSTGTPVLFVSDSSGSIYVALKPAPAVPLKPGELVEITGVSGPGLFAPIVDHAQAQVIGTTHLPLTAPRVILSDMLSGNFEGQWVEVEGLVHAVRESGTHIILDLSLRDGTTTAITARQPGVDYTQLIDSGIVLRGLASPNFNRQSQVTGAHMLFPDLSSVKVVQAGAADPFKLPVEPIADLLRFDPSRTFVHRVHLRGAATLLWPGRMICIQEGNTGLCAKTQQTSPLQQGQLVDVVGFPLIGAFTPTLVEAIYRPQSGFQPVTAVAVTAKQALDGERDATLVTVQGRIIDENRNGGDPMLTVSSDDSVFTAKLPRQFLPNGTTPLAVGTLVRLTGICSVESGGTTLGTGEGFSIPKSFSILQRSRDDVTIVQRPSWWNAEHSLRALGLALALIVLALSVIVFLRRRVTQQTATIRAQLAETQGLREAAEFQAAHDSLTGLYNRKAIFDMLRHEVSLATRAGTTTGVIMLDLDHFKHINDTYGHAAGDDVLKETVRRILPAVRSTDWVGRYGGEEFLIVLPQCDREQVQLCAERIRCAICNGSIMAQGARLMVSASLGATVARFPLDSEQDAVSTADLALYEAKNKGRNRVVFHEVNARQPHKQRNPLSKAACLVPER